MEKNIIGHILDWIDMEWYNLIQIVRISLKSKIIILISNHFEFKISKYDKRRNISKNNISEHN